MSATEEHITNDLKLSADYSSSEHVITGQRELVDYQ